MSTASQRTIQVLEQIVKVLPVGTNLALLHLMWAMLNGSFLKSRGAIHTALAESGFSLGEIRRSWAALRYGVWSITELIARWRALVFSEGQWQVREYDGWRAVPFDITVFWRPKLKGWRGRFFNSIANRYLKGVGFGLVTQVGQVEGQRMPLLKRIIRVPQDDLSEAELKVHILQQAPYYLEEGEVCVHDAGAALSQVQTAGIPRFVLRLATNCTGRRNYLPPPNTQGRPREYGEKVRPLPRKRLERVIPSTPPDVTESFMYRDRTIEAKGWLNLVRSDQKVAESNDLFHIWVYEDPQYQDPLVLGTNLETNATIPYLLYIDRWPVEQPPLVAKQTLGLHRQFVFAALCCHRLPELALLVANILTYLALVLPPIPTGFWDRWPKRTSGRLRRKLAREDFPKDYPFDERVRKKRSVTDHLAKGILGHRRQKQQN
jgi:hypothetical protein